MKKFTFLMLLGFLSFFGQAQIAVSENFDLSLVPPAGWTYTGYFGSVAEVCDGFSMRDNLDETSTTGNMTTPNYAAISNGTDVTVSFDYKVVDWSAAVDPTAPGWGEVLVNYSTDDGATWQTEFVVNDGNHVTSNTCATMSFTIPAASVPAGSDFKLQFVGNWAAGNFYIYLDNITAIQEIAGLPTCSTLLTPTPGSTGVSINTDLEWTAATNVPTDYHLTVGTTSGGTDVLDTNTGLSTVYNLLPTLEYSTTYYVNITPSNANGDAVDCQEFMFTTGADPNAPVDCSTGAPINVQYCYDNNDTTTWNFQSSDGSPLNLFFNAGGIENCCDDIIVYDGADNTAPVLYYDNNGGDLTGLSINSTGDSIYIEIDSDGSVSCASNSTCCTSPWDFDVSCIDTTALPNCNAVMTSPENGAVEVNEDADIVWSPASILVNGYNVNVGTTPGGSEIGSYDTAATTVDPGTLPYETTIYVSIVPYNDNGDADCTGGAGEFSFTTKADPNQVVDCSSNEVINTTYCYSNNDITEWWFASSDGAPISLTFNAGILEESSWSGNTYDDLFIYDGSSDSGVLLYDSNDGIPGNNDLTGMSFVANSGSLYIYFDADGSVSCESSSSIIPWDFDVSCVDTSALPNCNAVMTSPAEGDIDVNEEADITWSPASLFVTGYNVYLGTTSGGSELGSFDTTETTLDPGTLPFDTIIYVTIVPYNDNGDAECTDGAGTFSFTTKADPNQIVDCSTGEVINTVYCYNSSENESVNAFYFTSSDGAPLSVFFNSGNVENNWDELYIIDSDGTNLNADTPYGNGGNLAGLQFVSSGDSLTIYVESDSSVSCQSSTSINPWDFDVTCVDTTALPNCDAALTAPANGEQGVDEDEDIFWSPATVLVTGYSLYVGTTPGGTDVIDGMDVGDVLTYDLGTLEYSTTYYVTIVPYNDNGDAEGCTEYNFTVRNDPNQIVDCGAAEIINTVYCYGNNENESVNAFYFSGNAEFPLVITFNAGSVENNWDELYIVDSDGTVLNADALYGNGGDLTGMTYTTSGTSLTVYVESDGFGSCQSSTSYTPWDFDVYCLTCVPQTVDFAIDGDCDTDPDNPQFYVNVDITDMGDAASLTITDDQGGASQVATELGTVVMGPYTANTDVVVSVVNTDDGNCFVESEVLTFVCPPAPNECSIVYAGEDVTVTCDDNETELTAVHHYFGQDTNTYLINQLESCPQPATTGGIPTSLTIDDRWSDVINIGFDFCFFGGVYNQILIGSNGVLSFELENADSGNGWAFAADDTLPNNDNASLTEANIFGVAHDINPAVCGDINYMVLGSAPYRQFVVNYTNVCHFSCTSLMSSSQIILYESSNNIDINIFDKPTCTTWNGGRAIVGVQNIEDTVAFTPPGRNTGVWEVTDEFWRFSPGGDESFTFEWLDGDNNVIGTDETVTVAPTETTTYTAAVTYNLCTGGTSTVTNSVVVTVEGGYPEVEITEEPLSEYCPGVVLTAVSEENVSYLWTTGEETESITALTNGVYGVTATNENGCSSYLEYEVTSIDGSSSMLSDYTILANERVFLHGNNMVLSGGVGVMSNNGQIKLRQNSHINGFGEATSFSLQQDSTIGEEIDQAADVLIPPFIYNTMSNSDSPSVTVPAGQMMTLDGEVYDLIDIRQGATVVFTQSNVFVNKIKTLDNSIIEFEGCTNLYLNDMFILAKNSVLNTTAQRVSLFVNNDVQVNKNCKVEALIYVNGSHQILAKGENINTPDADYTFMKGLFIAERVHGDQNVYWEAGDICQPCPTYEDASMDRNFEVVTWPNPSDTKFNLKYRSVDFFTEASVNVFDLSGKLIHTATLKPGEELKFGSELEGGIYIVKVQQGDNSEVVRLIKH